MSSTACATATTPTSPDGDATTVEPAATTAPWLTEAPGGGLMFWAPTTGATTKNSEHPRTELNSLTNFAAGQGTHTLNASLTVLAVPRDGQGIIVGQIHGADDISSVPFLMLRYQDGQLRVVVKQTQSGSDSAKYPLIDNLPVGQRLDYSISDTGDGNMVCTATWASATRTVTIPIPAVFKNATVRFQAGDYQQADDPGGPQDGGRVIFHRLDKSAYS